MATEIKEVFKLQGYKPETQFIDLKTRNDKQKLRQQLLDNVQKDVHGDLNLAFIEELDRLEDIQEDKFEIDFSFLNENEEYESKHKVVANLENDAVDVYRVNNFIDGEFTIEMLSALIHPMLINKRLANFFRKEFK